MCDKGTYQSDSLIEDYLVAGVSEEGKVLGLAGIGTSPVGFATTSGKVPNSFIMAGSIVGVMDPEDIRLKASLTVKRLELGLGSFGTSFMVPF